MGLGWEITRVVRPRVSSALQPCIGTMNLERAGRSRKQGAADVSSAVLFSDWSAGKMPAAPWGPWNPGALLESTVGPAMIEQKAVIGASIIRIMTLEACARLHHLSQMMNGSRHHSLDDFRQFEHSAWVEQQSR